MDTIRTVLIFALALVSLLLWQAWQQDYPPPAAPAPVAATAPPEELPGAPPADPGSRARLPEQAPAAAGGIPVTVVTDTLHVTFDTRGATLVRAELPRYPISLELPQQALVLLQYGPAPYYVIQGGLLGPTGAPTHNAVYGTAATRYSLAADEDVLEVPFTREEQGLRVTKTFRFERGSYLVGVRYLVENHSGAEWRGQSYAQIQRDDPGRAGRMLIYTYVGAVISTPELRYEKIDFDDMREQKLARDISDGWAAMLQHYFVTALLPVDRLAPYHYYTMALPEDRFAIGAIAPAQTVPAGGSAVFEERLYIGPKEQARLAAIAEGLELTVDYGALWFIAKPLFWCLQRLHELTGNWGWAIILVTVALKVLFYRLSAAGYRSMANMRRVQPRILALRDRYKDDRARLNQAMMQIYKEEKINPFGGCLPIVVQIPVFIALYWVLLESVELRQAPFVLWLHDLSTPDPYWVLPIVMGVTMLVQQKLNPAPLDPVQEKVMMVLPFVFTIFFGFFPAGLVLYWVVNNVLSIAQQWLITRSIDTQPVRPGG
jgi:YidC/Oxa1 family membrane protein insertase